MVEEIVGEMDYLRIREQKLRDTNESTNTRVKWFGFGTTFLLIGLWVWQIMYLRAYFRYDASLLVLTISETHIMCSPAVAHVTSATLFSHIRVSFLPPEAGNISLLALDR